MPKTNNLIELNGKYYDVVTGAAVARDGVSPQHVVKTQKLEVAARPHLGHRAAQSVDGMSRQTPRTAHPIQHHQPARSTTLMRHAVKQPAAPAKPLVKATSPMDITAGRRPVTKPAIVPKLSHSQIHPARAQRAGTAVHSDVIRRFAAPAAQPQARPAAAPVAARPAAVAHVPQHHVKPAEKSDIFAHALAAAAEHEQKGEHRIAAPAKKHSRRKGKLLAVGGVAAAFLAIIGVVAYFNKSAFEIQFASMRAGFNASLPGYQPNGYSVKGMQYGPGSVTVGFSDGSSNSFSVAQKQSNWDSDTLMDNFVATSDQSYQAYQANGRTIFIYGKDNATWVNGGVWYQLKSNGLSQAEMLKVASTL